VSTGRPDGLLRFSGDDPNVSRQDTKDWSVSARGAPWPHLERPASLDDSEVLPPITEPYALFVCAPSEIDEQGRRWTDAAWAKDLALHLDYLTDVTLVSPVRKTKTTSANWVSLNEPPFDRLKFIDLPAPTGWGEVVKMMPGTILRYWQAIGRARIVHCGFGGWPIADGWLVAPLAKLRRKFVLANVESSFWRACGTGSTWRGRLRGALGEALTRFSLRLADIRLFTSKAYLRELMPPGAPRAYVTPATWLNDEWILGDDDARSAWDAKQGPVRVLFAARLIPEKGIYVLLSAVRAAAEAGTDVEVSIQPLNNGGSLRDECIAFAQSLAGKVNVAVVDEVPFGEPFMRFMRGFDAVLVPSLSDEQPRIIYDAFSQAVPVIGSATGGICEVVESGVSGRLSPPSDVESLTESILWAGRNRSELRQMGLRGLASVRNSTHLAMHQNRHKLLLEALGKH
jgi:glycosyltransferase involved in cell wall biosynthesis